MVNGHQNGPQIHHWLCFLSVESLLSGPEVDSVYRTIIMHLSGSYSVTELFTTKKKPFLHLVKMTWLMANSYLFHIHLTQINVSTKRPVCKKVESATTDIKNLVLYKLDLLCAVMFISEWWLWNQIFHLSSVFGLHHLLLEDSGSLANKCTAAISNFGSILILLLPLRPTPPFGT